VGIRESLNENPQAVVKGLGVVFLFALVLLIWHFWPGSKVKVTAKEFYSDDDGTTWFADDAGKIPPFDHNGKEAVLAKVYICGSHKFVGYLEKFSPEAREKMLNPQPQQTGPGMKKTNNVIDPRAGILYKKPHDENWVSQMDLEAYKRTVQVHCPSGSDNALLPWVPQ
jgi:hypothetical protein